MKNWLVRCCVVMGFGLALACGDTLPGEQGVEQEGLGQVEASVCLPEDVDCVPITRCGDGQCTGNETSDRCPLDCGYCGDGACNHGETTSWCAQDCGYCGDGVCRGETSATCGQDCPYCGNGTCDSGETSSNCRTDCSICGDQYCTGSENPSTCPLDCGPWSCGNHICEPQYGESSQWCPTDCSCGNFICEPQKGETRSNCFSDCH